MQSPSDNSCYSRGVKDVSQTYNLSVRDFALPVPRTGSIETLSGYGRQIEGQAIHLKVQAERESDYELYEAELKISRDFEHEGYVFRVGGRMDGFFPGTPPTIEEIKSSFSATELAQRLRESPDDHPYCLQLKTYGYLYWLEHQIIPKLTFHLVSTRNGESKDLELKLDIAIYEEWLSRRLDELVIETKKAEKRAARRKKVAANFAFPFSQPRSGQGELVQTVEEGMLENARMLVQAPTGLGKTVGVLYPTLKEALTRGQNVIYVTPKNSQHAVAEDALTRFRETGADVRSLTITAKSKICFKAEPICNPRYCEYAKDHYTKVHEHGVIDQLAKKKKLTAKTFRKLGEKYEVCPFEIQLDAAVEADTIICDYNYVFSPRSAFGRIADSSSSSVEGKPNLVIDEAHNLPSRAMDYYSPALSSATLERMRDEVRALPKRFAGEVEGHLDGCIQALVLCKPAGFNGKETRITPAVDRFIEQEGLLRAFLSRYLDSNVEIQPKDVVLRLTYYWAEFTAALEYVTDPARTEFFTTFHSNPTGGTVKITCCDASKMLSDCYDSYEQVVGFSATLKPFDFYTKLSGLDPEKTKLAEFTSPFPASHRKLLVIPQISTKYSERERNYPRIAEAIARVSALKPGNYFAFFPSFDFLERVLAILHPPEGFQVLRQFREMRAADIESVLEQLRATDKSTIVFAVQGGVFSEGVDYPGKMIIGAFVVGPPLPNFDLERETMREYYQKSYGAGFDYAYAYPAMAKAVQAAGRVIRSETDRGLIVLMDNRFLQSTYTQSMPEDWFKESPQELVSTAILAEVSAFWQQTTEPAPSSIAEIPQIAAHLPKA